MKFWNALGVDGVSEAEIILLRTYRLSSNFVLEQLKLMDLYLVLLKGTTLPIIELLLNEWPECLTVPNIPY